MREKMKTMTRSWPETDEAYATSQYLLVAEPHAALMEEIQKLKQHFADTYDYAGAAYGKPNMILARFEQYDAGMEDPAPA